MSALHQLLAAARRAARRLHDRERHRAARAGPEKRCGAGACGARRATSSRWTGWSKWLEANGFDRTATVREVGEYAVRGGILDLWAPGTEQPIRLDFFGDTLETIRPFDAESQRTTGQLQRLDLVPASEAILTEETIGRFRQNYRAAFGAVLGGDPLYEAVSEGRRFAGMEHWLPFFYEKLETLFDYLPDAPVVVGHLVGGGDLPTAWTRCATTSRRGERPRRKSVSAGAAPYKPIPPDALYLTADEWRAQSRRPAARAAHALRRAGRHRRPAIDMGGRTGRSFAAERAAGDVNVFDALVAHVAALQKSGRKVMLASWSEGARDRLGQVLVDHGLLQPEDRSRTGASLQALPEKAVGLAVLPLETGLRSAGHRHHRRPGRSGRPLHPLGAQAEARRRCADRGREPRRRRSRRPCRPRHRPLRRAAAPSRRRARRTIAWKSSTPATTACSCRSKTSSS